MYLKRFGVIFTMVLQLIGMPASPVLAGPPEQPVEVTGAEPAAAPPGTINLDVKITGANFDKSAKVYFLKAGTEDLGDVTVNGSRTSNSSEIIANINVSETAVDQQEYDIEVRMSRGRGGKGTTLFKVDSSIKRSECGLLDFEATFEDAAGDGLYSDGKGSYPAIGGRGFRLDTNGSQQMERQNDDRHVWIDFSVDPNVSCDTEDPNDAAGAAGFCTAIKGIDLRFEHQVQILPGLCSLGPDGSMLMAVRVGFLAEPDGLLKAIFKNGRDNGSEETGLNLTYGCLHPNLEQGDIDPGGRALVTREGDADIWRIEGFRACLHTNLGQKLQAVNPDTGELETVYLQVPFGLRIVQVPN